MTKYDNLHVCQWLPFPFCLSYQPYNVLKAIYFLFKDFLKNDFTFAQTAPFSDLPVAERRGRMDKKRRRVEMEKMEEKVEEMVEETGEVVAEKVPWVPPPPLKI